MFEKYRVKGNETLDDIAKKFHTNVSYIEDLNNLSYQETLREGMDIIVPKNKEKYFDTYTINSGDTLYGIARKYNINPELLAALNGLNMDDYIYIHGNKYKQSLIGKATNTINGVYSYY